MCGIVGAFLKKEAAPFPVHALAEAIKHRGPDDEGYLLLNPATGAFESRGGADTHPALRLSSIDLPWPSGTRLVFGHRRLSILDLSPAGHQPMSDPKEEVWITYNGEIYNYKELRQELEQLGVKFFSGTDTEVILAAYKMWGQACLHRFNGMWAFALWDARTQTLFCARDRFGVKPFYYTEIGGNFFFASEIKALLRLPQISKNVSEETLFDFLTIGLLDHRPETFFSGIFSLKAGHALTLRENSNPQIRPWYSFPEAIGQQPYHASCAEEFRGRFTDAVKLRLRSDVPVGSCLSGGLDSSSIVCTLGALSATPPHLFSGCFEDPACNEMPYMKAVLERVPGTSHFVFPTGGGFWKEWPELTYHQEEPFGSMSLYSHGSVLKEVAKQKIPVLLNGQGGDELLGGYPRYQYNRLLSRALQGKSEGWQKIFRYPKGLALLFWHYLPRPLQRQALEQIAFFGNSFIAPEIWKRNYRRIRDYYQERLPLQMNLRDSLRSDMLTYILPVLLRYEDKNSMRFSIEIRLPFLDYRLVEWVSGLEEAAKVESGISKRILRDAMKGVLPEKVRLRTDKMGWETPQARWLNEGRATILDFFKGPEAAIAPYISIKRLQSVLQRPQWNDLLWRFIHAEMWLRVFFGKFEPLPASEPLPAASFYK